MPLNFDPTHVGADKLYEYARDMIIRGYSEIDNYYIVINEDLLSTGIARFQIKYREAREWGNRILQMMQDARRLFTPVSDQANGKKSLLEAKAIAYVQQMRQTDEFKGLDANERGLVARTSKLVMPFNEDYQKWDSLKQELRIFIQALNEKHKDLLTARDDLKAQLWSIRIQGVVGDIVPKYISTMNEQSKSEPHPDGRDLDLGGNSKELDELLGPG